MRKVPVTRLHCFQVYIPLCCFLSSHWWPVLMIIFFKLLHIFGPLSKWNYTTLLCVNVTQVLYKGFSIVSKWTFISNSSILLCVALTQSFCLFIWVIYDPYSLLCCVDCHAYFSSLCKWTLHFTAFRSLSDQFLLLHRLNWYLKEKLSFSFWVLIIQYFNFWTV